MEGAGRHHRGTIIRLVFSALLLFAAGWLLFNKQYVWDVWSAYNYKPASSVASIVDKTSMNDNGKFYFYASHPELQERGQFNEACQSLQTEKTAVLGCYAGQRIYLFDVDNSELDGIVEVTAAHEMLHAAYDRLDRGERDRINDLVDAESKKVSDPGFEALMKAYEQTEPGERLNELHSIIGTQVASLSGELEEYYGQYFDDRQQVVELYQQYSSVFEELKRDQERLVSELKSLADSINTETSAYNQRANEFSRDVEAYQKVEYNSQAAADAARSELLARKASLDQQRQGILAKQREYEQKRERLAVLNTRSADLNQSIDSSVDPVQTVD